MVYREATADRRVGDTDPVYRTNGPTGLGQVLNGEPDATGRARSRRGLPTTPLNSPMNSIRPA